MSSPTDTPRSDRERLARSLLVVGWDSPTVTSSFARELDSGIGGVILHSRNVQSAEQLAATLRSAREIQPSLIVGVDQEGGRIGHLARAGTPLTPGAAALGSLDDPSLTRDVAAELAQHLHEIGIDASYSPVADVQLDPANPIIRTRSFGADPLKVREHVNAWIEGTQSSSVAACVKHFPGHGSTATDSHLGDAIDRRSAEEIEQADLVPFRAAIEAGVAQVMTSHVRFPEIDDVPSTVSPHWIRQVLRGELGFSGVIISDALEMSAIRERYGEAEGAVRALGAGVDQLCIAEPNPALHEKVVAEIVTAMEQGRLDVDELQNSADRILRQRERFAADASRGRSTPENVDGAGMRAAHAAIRGGVQSDGLNRLRPNSSTSGVFIVDMYRPPKAVLEWDGSDLVTLVRQRTELADGLSLHNSEPFPDAESVLKRANGRALVIASQDAALDSQQSAFREALLSARPDAVLIETGLADPRVDLVTHGRGTANLLAAADLLAEAAGAER